MCSLQLATCDSASLPQGCTLSSAIAALLAHGMRPLDAVVLAKAYVHQGIGAAVRLGEGPVRARFERKRDSTLRSDGRVICVWGMQRR